MVVGLAGLFTLGKIGMLSIVAFVAVALLFGSYVLQIEKFRLFVKSGGGKSSITLRDSKLNKLFKVVEFFYPIR